MNEDTPAESGQNVKDPEFTFCVHFNKYPRLTAVWCDAIALEFYGTVQGQKGRPHGFPCCVYSFRSAEERADFAFALLAYAEDPT